ncbi:hypothetical protein HK098_008266 [Nowakowskiella sp. JEL0407]|nr:hypothetical protein HK098_008266 [Nowakowskiella sp. JEL0407]
MSTSISVDIFSLSKEVSNAILSDSSNPSPATASSSTQAPSNTCLICSVPYIKSNLSIPVSLQFTSTSDNTTLSFDYVTARAHHKSPFHLENLQRKMSNRPLLTLDEYDALSTTTTDKDESQSSSDIEDDNENEKEIDLSDEEENEEQLLGRSHGGEKMTRRRKDGFIGKSPFIKFNLNPDIWDYLVSKYPSNFNSTQSSNDSSQPREIIFLVYRQILVSPLIDPTLPENHASFKRALLNLQFSPKSTQSDRDSETNRYWTLILVSSGNFAGAVFDCATKKAVVHKTFHRYTTRRKQGGAQSTSDQANGKAKSAGSDIRRYNERALLLEIHSLITLWTPYITSSSHIFMHTPGANRKIFDDTILSKKKPQTSPTPTAANSSNSNIDQSTSTFSKIRSFPFTTGKPTFSELEKCFKKLYMGTICIVEATVAVADTNQNDVASADVESTSKYSVEKTLAPKLEKLVVDDEKNSISPTETIKLLPPPSEMMQALIAIVKSNDVTKFKSLTSTFSDPTELSTLLNTLLPEITSLLHVSAINSSNDVIPLLLDLGADPTQPSLPPSLPQKPYEVAKNKDTRDVFRRYFGNNEELCRERGWSIKDCGIPSVLTDEMEEKKKEKERERKKREKERKKELKEKKKDEEEAHHAAAAAAAKEQEEIAARKAKSGKSKVGGVGKSVMESSGMSAEARMKLDREKRAFAAESRMKNAGGKCACCGNLLTPVRTFDKWNYKFCSTDCIQKSLAFF